MRLQLCRGVRRPRTLGGDGLRPFRLGVPTACLLAAAACGETPADPLSALETAETAAFQAGAALYPPAPVYCLGVTGPALQQSPVGAGPLRPPPPGVLRAVGARLAPAQVRPVFACRDPGGFPPGMISLTLRWVELAAASGGNLSASAGVEVHSGAKWHSYACVLRREQRGGPWDPGPCADDGMIID